MSELEFIYRVAFNEPPLENDDSWEFYGRRCRITKEPVLRKKRRK